MKKFDLKKSYKIGVLKSDEDQSSPDPQFLTKPPALVLTGKQLSDAGFPTLSDYLGYPDIPFSDKKIVSCYEVQDNGLMNFFGSQTPLPKQQTNLADNPNMMFPQRLGTGADNSEYYRDQLKRKDNKILELEQKYEAQQNTFLTEKAKWLETDSEQRYKIVKLETELKAFKEMVEGMKQGQSLNDKGIGNKILDLMNGNLGTLLAGLAANNPEVQSALTKGIVKMGSMFDGGSKPEIPKKQDGVLNGETNTIVDNSGAESI